MLVKLGKAGCSGRFLQCCPSAVIASSVLHCSYTVLHLRSLILAFHCTIMNDIVAPEVVQQFSKL